MEVFFHMFNSLCSKHGIRTKLEPFNTKVRPARGTNGHRLDRIARALCGSSAHPASLSRPTSRCFADFALSWCQTEDEDGEDRVGVVPRRLKRRRRQDEEEEEEEEEEEVEEEEEEAQDEEEQAAAAPRRRDPHSSKRARVDSSSQPRRGAAAASSSSARRTSHV